MAITAATRQDIIELVVTALNAAPGTTLLNELVAIVDGGGTLADVAANLAASDTFTARYPAFQTAEEFAAEWLGNLIPEAGADAMAEAKALVVAAVNGGTTAASLLLQAQEFLSAASETDAAFGTSAANFNNKAEVASHQTLTNEVAALDTSVLSSVTSDDATVATAKTSLDTVVVAGEAFSLTKNLDTKTTGAGADTFNSANTATVTLSSGDNIDGGDGSDTLSISNTAANSGLGTGATSANIENVKVNSVAATTLDMALFSGVTDVYSNGSLAATTFSNVGSYIPNVHLISTSADTAVNWASAATVQGTSDAMTVALNSAALTASANLTANGIETFNVLAQGASGTATRSQTLTSNTARSVAITGDASTNITVNLAGAGATAALAGSVTGNAATNRMDVTADGTDILTVDLGAGDDTLTMSAIGAKHTLTGGDGTDTLKLTQAVASGASTSATVSGWETLNVSDAGTGTVDMDAFSGVTKVIYDAGLGGATTVDDAVTGIEVEVDVTQTAQNLTVDLKTDGAADAITLTVDAIGAGDNIGTINASDAETLTIAVDDDTLDATGTLGITSITLGDATTVNISGDAATTISGATNPTAPVLTTINAGGMTDNISITGMNLAATGGTVTLGTGDDTFTVGTANGSDTIDISAGGKDTIVYTALGQSDAAGMDTIVGFTSGSDDIDLSGLANRNVTTTTQFGGVGSSKTAAEGKLGGTNTAVVVFQADENILWVDIDANGVLNASDFRVKLDGVSTIAATDLGLTAAGNTTALSDAAATVNTTTKTNASKVTTNEADTISTTLTFADTSTIDGAQGADSLTVSAVVGGTTIRLNNAGASGATDIALSNVETVTLAQTTAGVTTVNGLPTTVSSLTVSGASASLAVSATADDQVFNSSSNTDGANASTIEIGAYDTTVTTGAAADVFDTIQQDGSTITAGAGNDTFNITNVAAYDDDATLLTLNGGTGTDKIVFATSLTIAVDFTDTTDLVVTSVETLNLGDPNAASTVTLAETSTFTTLIADTSSGAVVVTGKGSELSKLTTITNTDGTEVFSLTVSDAGATLDLDAVTINGTGGDLDVISFQATGSNVLQLDGADVSLITGTAVAAGSTDTINIGVASATGADAITDDLFNAFETLTLVGTAALDLNIEDAALDVARTVNGDVGDNTIDLQTPTAAKTVNLGTGGTDTVELAHDSTGLVTVNGFTPGTGGDVINILTTAEATGAITMVGPIVTSGVAASSNATDPNSGFIFASAASQISGSLAAVGDGGAVEAAIIAGGLSGTAMTDGEFFIAAIDNGTDTGIYLVTANDTGISDATDLDGISHLVTLVGVTADQLVAANII